MKTIDELMQWMDGARDEFGDPSEPITQIFCRWVEPLSTYHGADLAAGTIDGLTHLRLRPRIYLPLKLETGSQGTMNAEGMPSYGANRIAPGIWSIAPCLFLPNYLHTFVTLYDVPLTVPWETRVIEIERTFDFKRRFSLFADA